MIDLPLWQVDAFADRVFAGNPAAVVVAPDPLDSNLMQAIAAENNLAETAFLVPGAAKGRYGLRWFTPVAEVDLCGHATLASGHVVLSGLDKGLDEGPNEGPKEGLDRAVFDTASGVLTVTREGEGYALDLPAQVMQPVASPGGLAAAIGATVLECHAGPKLVAVLESAGAVADLAPDLGYIAALDFDGLIVTAAGPGGEGGDFVSRYFAPHVGIDEDPVTGSAHCQLMPFWAGRLGRQSLTALQVSKRGGRLDCRLDGDRVVLAGKVAPYLAGRLRLPG
ncbi:MAG: PhzF family phenazine biosynthesis protein [Rhodospirillales bacterium]